MKITNEIALRPLQVDDAKMNRVQISRTNVFVDALSTLREASARATHHFLNEDDIQKLISSVKTGLSNIQTLFVVYDDQKPMAFMGIETDKIKMLFVSPEYFGKGMRRQLAERAITQ